MSNTAAQGNSEDVLPEALMGTIRLNHLDLSVAQFLDTATGELSPRQTPANRRRDATMCPYQVQQFSLDVITDADLLFNQEPRPRANVDIGSSQTDCAGACGWGFLAEERGEQELLSQELRFSAPAMRSGGVSGAIKGRCLAYDL